MKVNFSSMNNPRKDLSGDVEVDIIREERDSLRGWSEIFFVFKGESFSAYCDTKYENGYYSVPKPVSEQG